MNPTQNPDPEPIASPLAPPAATQPTSWSRMLLVALPILVSGSLMVNTVLALPVRGVSAIGCGLAMLCYGPHLFRHTLVSWARRA